VRHGDPKLFILGNKIDLGNERQVTSEEGKILAGRYEAEFFEVSALSGENVIEVFTSIGKKLFNLRDDAKKEAEGNIIYNSISQCKS